MCQAEIYFFVSLFLQNIKRPLLVSHKFELVICLIIPYIPRKFSLAFQNTEVAFKWCSTNVHTLFVKVQFIIILSLKFAKI